MVLRHICRPFWLLTFVKLYQVLIYQRRSKTLHLTSKFLKTENKFVSFGLQVSPRKPACPGGRAQSSPYAASKVFEVMHHCFSSLYTLESEQEENIHENSSEWTGEKRSWKTKEEIQQRCASDPLWLFRILLTPSWSSSENVCTSSSEDAAVGSKEGEVWQVGIPEVHVPLHCDMHCTSLTDFGLSLR